MFAVNRDFEEDYALTLDLPDMEDFVPFEHIEMAGFGLKDENSIVSAPVKPANAAALPEKDGRTVYTTEVIANNYGGVSRQNCVRFPGM